MLRGQQWAWQGSSPGGSPQFSRSSSRRYHMLDINIDTALKSFAANKLHCQIQLDLLITVTPIMHATSPSRPEYCPLQVPAPNCVNYIYSSHGARDSVGVLLLELALLYEGLPSLGHAVQ